MDDLVVRWVIGLVVSLVAGGAAAWLVLRVWRRLPEEGGRGDGVPAWVMGLGERLFFTLAIAFQVPGAAVAMMAWLTVKMLTNWNRPISADGQNAAEVTTHIRRAMASLFAGLVSLTFALIGGLICAGRI